ncbi:hypothetical protein [Salinarimonas sp.]|uniref:hypothetical protein n=1 Tax=Salinarimonas sp. TaxID=2766526 RepID=UPI00391B0B1C
MQLTLGTPSASADRAVPRSESFTLASAGRSNLPHREEICADALRSTFDLADALSRRVRELTRVHNLTFIPEESKQELRDMIEELSDKIQFLRHNCSDFLTPEERTALREIERQIDGTLGGLDGGNMNLDLSRIGRIAEGAATLIGGLLVGIGRLLLRPPLLPQRM